MIMSSYQVGANKPIKLKVSISTSGHASTSFFLNDPENDGQFQNPPKNNTFTNTDNTSWRQINEGEAVQGRSIKVRTILTFPSGITDENTFNLAVNQAKRSYKLEMSGGTPDQASFTFEVQSMFGIVKVAQFESVIEFT